MLIQKTILFFIFFYHSSYIFSFAAGTLVKTPDSYVPIEEIKQGDIVIAYDIQTKELKPKKVTLTFSSPARTAVILRYKEHTITTSPIQFFYTTSGWHVASLFKPQNNTRALNIVRTINCNQNQKILLYDLCVEDIHTFCITPHNIIVHNTCHSSY